MAIYRGREVFFPADVDKVSAEDIRNLTGGIDNELANHRKGMMALYILMTPKESGEQKVKMANDIGYKLVMLNEAIERIVAEGRLAKIGLV